MTALVPFTLTLNEFQVASFTVLNGVGGSVRNSNQKTCVIWDPAVELSAGEILPVTKNPHIFNVRALKWGRCGIFYRSFRDNSSGGLTAKPDLFVFETPPLVLKVKAPFVPNYVPGVMHNHKPSGKWAEIRKAGEAWIAPASIGLSGVLSATTTPREYVNAVMAIDFSGKPLAKDHLMWYLDIGNGRDYNEDGVIISWLKEDPGLRQRLRAEYERRKAPVGKVSGFFEFGQSAYQNIDYRYAFGAIDRLDYEFDFDRQMASIWFKDRYEWHPYKPGYYDVQTGDEDARPTNTLHAALVELKLEGASDFWMKGHATFPLNWITVQRDGEYFWNQGFSQEGMAEDPL